MSEHLQSGLHLDADQLNAFVEHALPPHEREQTLAHLAVCPDCRAVVSLSLPPVEESPRPQAAPVRRPWFLGWNLGWNLVWPVAAALAALVPFILYLHRTETSRSPAAPPTELATSHPPAPPLVPPAPLLGAGSQSPPAAPAKPATPPTDATEKRSGSLASPTPIPAEREGASDEISPTPKLPSSAPQPQPAIPLRERFSAGADGAAPPQSKAAPGNNGIFAGTGQANLDQKTIAGELAGSPSPPPPPPPPLAAPAASASAATDTVTVTNASPMLDTSDAALGGMLQGSTFQALVLQAALPSGRPVLSATSSGRLVLALDTRNKLFFSEDGGRRWKPVPTQWKGRAVKVDLANPPAAQARAATQAAGAGAASSGLAGFAALRATPSPNAALTGTVTDPTGAVIPNASIVVTDAAKQTVRNAKAGSDGRYRIDGLAPGNYHLEATAPGFEKLELPITLAPAQQNLADLKLQIGAASQTVAVTAASALDLEEVAPTLAVKKKAAAPAAPVQPAPLFEITTASGDRWISPDGQTWTRRQTSK